MEIETDLLVVNPKHLLDFLNSILQIDELSIRKEIIDSFFDKFQRYTINTSENIFVLKRLFDKILTKMIFRDRQDLQTIDYFQVKLNQINKLTSEKQKLNIQPINSFITVIPKGSYFFKSKKQGRNYISEYLWLAYSTTTIRNYCLRKVNKKDVIRKDDFTCSYNIYKIKRNLRILNITPETFQDLPEVIRYVLRKTVNDKLKRTSISTSDYKSLRNICEFTTVDGIQFIGFEGWDDEIALCRNIVTFENIEIIGTVDENIFDLIRELEIIFKEAYPEMTSKAIYFLSLLFLLKERYPVEHLLSDLNIKSDDPVFDTQDPLIVDLLNQI